MKKIYSVWWLSQYTPRKMSEPEDKGIETIQNEDLKNQCPVPYIV